MRRRSERKKSEASPAPSSRRSRRTRHTPDEEKNYDETPTKTDSSPNRASSEERVETTRRGRSTRKPRTSSKRASLNDKQTEERNDEEENGVISTIHEKNEDEAAENEVEADDKPVEENVNEVSQTADDSKTVGVAEEKKDVDIGETSPCEQITNFSNEQENFSEVLITGNNAEDKHTDKEVSKPMPMPNVETESENSVEIAEKPNNDELKKEKESKPDENENTLKSIKEKKQHEEKSSNFKTEQFEADVEMLDLEKPTEKQPQKVEIQRSQNNKAKVAVEETNNNSNNSTANVEQNRTTRKRKWMSKKPSEGKDKIMAISTDSLKNLIDDVQPVPLSDVHLDSSSETENAASDHEDRNREASSPSDNEGRRKTLQKKEVEKKAVEKKAVEKKAVEKTTAAAVDKTTIAASVTVPQTVLPTLHNSPSPPRNQKSNVLYITNLVRPFTVMQLKGLLARTGKILDNGFWIDRIKSKCYVQYETEE